VAQPILFKFSGTTQVHIAYLFLKNLSSSLKTVDFISPALRVFYAKVLTVHKMYKYIEKIQILSLIML